MLEAQEPMVLKEPYVNQSGCFTICRVRNPIHKKADSKANKSPISEISTRLTMELPPAASAKALRLPVPPDRHIGSEALQAHRPE